jgi:hypothetical protein
MTNSFQAFQKQFEVFANQQAAEITAHRTILQSLLVSMLADRPNGTDLINSLRSDALATLGQTSPGEASNANFARSRQAARLQAEQFFEEMRSIFPGMKSTSRTSN